jgi:TonB family protein
MKKSVIAALVLVLGLTLAVASAEAPGTMVQRVVVDSSTRSKVLNEYTLLTRDAIQKSWTTPLDLSLPGAVKGRIRVDYTVKRSGELESLELVNGSGNMELDRSLLLAIRSAQPFPPFPDDVRAQRVLIRANFIVADVPTVPVMTVSQPVGEPPTAVQVPDQNPKKLIWGLPAGTSQQKEPEAAADSGPAPRPEIKKYRWGLQP